jgi:hypothetical protein
MKHALPAIIAVAAVALMSPAGAQDKPEVPKVRLAVGGKSAIFYLPLSITERLGYFRDAGLEVEIADVQSGARALQSLVGGRHLRPHHPDAVQRPAGRRGYAIWALSRIRACHDCIEIHRLPRAPEPERIDHRRHFTWLEHPFHGGLYAGA